VEASNCLRNGEKRQNPEGSSRGGLALTKNRRSWRVETWLPESKPAVKRGSDVAEFAVDQATLGL